MGQGPVEDFKFLEIAEQDVVEAMKGVEGYLDITPGDFQELYRAAYRLAVKRLLGSLCAEAVMSKKLVLLAQDLPLVEAAGLLAGKGISGAPVVDGHGRVVGVVSEQDFLREMGFGQHPSFMQIATHCLRGQGCMISGLHQRRVTDIMTAPPITGTPAMTIGSIAILFAERRINRLPILDGEGRPVGIVTRTDLAHSLAILGGLRQ